MLKVIHQNFKNKLIKTEKVLKIIKTFKQLIEFFKFTNMVSEN